MIAEYVVLYDRDGRRLLRLALPYRSYGREGHSTAGDRGGPAEPAA
ncbi:hypothetical protein [Streptomyces sp. NPDC006012]